MPTLMKFIRLPFVSRYLGVVYIMPKLQLYVGLSVQLLIGRRDAHGACLRPQRSGGGRRG